VKIIITGINGSGGSYLAEYIVENHPEVEVHGIYRWHSTTTTDNLKAIRDKIIVHEGDLLLDLPSIVRTLRKVKPDRIFNLASHANVRVCFDTPLAVFNNNVMSTANLLEAIRLECPDTLFQQCSTSEVYGNPLTTPIKESHPLAPVNPYASSKLAQESLCYAYYKSWGLKIIITRMFAYINPRRIELFASAFASQIAKIEARKQSFLLHGNLDSIRTLIDVRDAMRAYWIACDKCECGVPYNVGGTNPVSVGSFLDLLKKASHTSIVSKLDPNLLRPVDITNQIPDTSRFDKITGWKPEYSLEESIKFLLEYYRNNN